RRGPGNACQVRRLRRPSSPCFLASRLAPPPIVGRIHSSDHSVMRAGPSPARWRNNAAPGRREGATMTMKRWHWLAARGTALGVPGRGTARPGVWRAVPASSAPAPIATLGRPVALAAPQPPQTPPAPVVALGAIRPVQARTPVVRAQAADAEAARLFP